jgi:antitoxin component YwqK of YwqJK toxin-antitoxin module
MSSHSLNDLTVVQLRQKAKDMNLIGYSKLKKAELIDLINEGGRNQIPSKRGRPAKPAMTSSSILTDLTVGQLKLMAREKGLLKYSKMNKAELIDALNKVKSPKSTSPERKSASPKSISKNNIEEDFYSTGELKERRKFTSNNTGSIEEFYKNGQKKSERNVVYISSGGKEFSIGLEKEWWENGNNKEEILYDNDGEPMGGTRWYKNGNVEREKYLIDRKNRNKGYIRKVYDENGILISEDVKSIIS